MFFNNLSEELKNQDLFLPILIIFAGFGIGYVSQSILLMRIRKLAMKTASRYDDHIFDALGKLPLLFSIIVSFYLASLTVDLSDRTRSVVEDSLLVLGIAFTTILFSRFAVVVISYYVNKDAGGRSTTSLFNNIARIIIYILGILLVFQTLGIDITAILTALGVGGLAVALALQETLSNLFAGFYIILARKIRSGDYIKLETGEEGFVKDISWRNTTIKTLPNYYVIVPNSTLGSSIITNYHLPESEMSILLDIGVSYDSDLDEVERITVEVAKEVMNKEQGFETSFDPFIRYNNFGDSAINFTVIMRVKEFTDNFTLKHEFIKALHKRYRKEGIEVPYQKVDVNILKNETTNTTK